MTQTMQLVLGSQTYMQQFAKQATTPTRLLKDVEKDRDFALLDLKGAIPFVSPVRGTVLAHYGTVPAYGYIALMYFKLGKDEAGVFVSQMTEFTDQADRLEGCDAMVLMETDNPHLEYLLLSAWNRKLDVYTAQNTPLYAPVRTFAQRAQAGFGYHRAIYTIVDPDHPTKALTAEAASAD